MKTRRLKGVADDVNREMWQLCSNKNWEAIQQCLAEGKWDPNRPLVLALQPGGFLLLAAAVEAHQLAVARQLIELGADVNGRLPGEATPLQQACDAGNQEMVDLLLQAGADVNIKCPVSDDSDPGETPLMTAAMRQKRDIVEKLLQCGARMDAKTKRGRSALSWLLENGKRADLSMVRFFLANGCPVDGLDLHHPILARHLELVKLLLAQKLDVNKRFDWPRYSGCMEIRKHDTPLFVAVDYNAVISDDSNPDDRLAIIDLLLEAGADVNEQRGGKPTGITPLMLAVLHDEAEIANRLWRAGAVPHKEVSLTRNNRVGEWEWQTLKGPVSAIGLAEERPDGKAVRKLLLGHE